MGGPRFVAGAGAAFGPSAPSVGPDRHQVIQVLIALRARPTYASLCRRAASGPPPAPRVRRRASDGRLKTGPPAGGVVARAYSRKGVRATAARRPNSRYLDGRFLAARLVSYLGLSRIRVVIGHAGRHGVSFALYLSSCAASSFYVLWRIEPQSQTAARARSNWMRCPSQSSLCLKIDARTAGRRICSFRAGCPRGCLGQDANSCL